jgi:hypothetical protein
VCHEPTFRSRMCRDCSGGLDSLAGDRMGAWRSSSLRQRRRHRYVSVPTRVQSCRGRSEREGARVLHSASKEALS